MEDEPAGDAGLRVLAGAQQAGGLDGGAADSEARLQRALELGYRYLGKRDRTAAEVRAHLAAKEIDEPSVDATIAILERQGYVDDARYARVFVEDRRSLDDWGAERIERKLLSLGIDAYLVSDALSDRDAADELAAAVDLLRRNCGEAMPATERERARALAMLVRKGYDLELAYDAVRACSADTTAVVPIRARPRREDSAW